MNDVVKFKEAGVPTNTDELITGLTSVNTNLQGSMGGTPILRLMKAGYFVYGQDNIEVEPGSLWAVNPYSLQHGFACWGDGQLLGERMVPFNQQPPKREDLPDYGEPWNQQVSMNLQCMTGEDKGITVVYRGTSIGLRNAVKKLIDQLIAQAQKDPQHIVPLLSLQSDSYRQKNYGEIFYPELEIRDWLNMESGVSADDDPKQRTKPTESELNQPEEPKPTPAPEPTRRRRRNREDQTKPAVEWVDGGPPPTTAEPLTNTRSRATEGGRRRRRRR